MLKEGSKKTDVPKEGNKRQMYQLDFEQKTNVPVS